MARNSPYPELEALQARTGDLSHLKQNMLMTYAILGGLEDSVERTAAELAELAELIGVPAPHFSRARRELERAGCPERTHTVGQVKFFRLGEAATARQVVVPLPSRPTG